jgi:hypothetical protein
MSWCIDGEGNRIEGRPSAPDYRIGRKLKPDLPAIEEFGLEDAPPGQ